LGESINMGDWYTYDQAIAQLERNKQTEKPLDPKYVHSLVRYGKVKVQKIGRASLYWKPDIDGYTVEERGAKSGRAKQEAARESGRKAARKGSS
jgi:hypothetical protein